VRAGSFCNSLWELIRSIWIRTEISISLLWCLTKGDKTYSGILSHSNDYVRQVLNLRDPTRLGMEKCFGSATRGFSEIKHSVFDESILAFSNFKRTKSWFHVELLFVLFKVPYRSFYCYSTQIGHSCLLD
jgi:hypothetical protein